MELLGGDAHFTAQTEFAAIGEPGGGVDVDRGAVHAGGEGGNGFFAGGNNGLAVAGGVGGDVGTASLTSSTHLTARM